MLMVIEEEEASRGDLRRGRISRIGRNSRRTDAIVGATAVAEEGRLPLRDLCRPWPQSRYVVGRRGGLRYDQRTLSGLEAEEGGTDAVAAARCGLGGGRGGGRAVDMVRAAARWIARWFGR